jgi:hypothetical protein
MKFWLLILPLLCGCNVARFNKPPGWASVVATHSRFFGVSAAYEGVGIKLGWGSTTWTVIPVSTNAVFIPKFSDTFSAGQTVNPFDTRVREYIQTGWTGDATPPPAMMFAPIKKP